MKDETDARDDNISYIVFGGNREERIRHINHTANIHSIKIIHVSVNGRSTMLVAERLREFNSISVVLDIGNGLNLS